MFVSMFCERVETTNVPGANTSGLKRPKSPSVPMPTLPRLENEATSLSLSVKPRNGTLVLTTLVPLTMLVV